MTRRRSARNHGLTGATLFSGIGAPETAMPSWHWPWCAEVEKFPSAVLAARHPDSVNLGDVTANDFCERALAVARPDVLVFGSPCQDFSVAGKRLGMDGARGNLALAALRIVARLEPRWFVFENVPGLLSNWSGGPQCPPEPGSSIDTLTTGTDRSAHVLAFSGRERGDDGRGYDRPPISMVECVGALDTVKPWRVAATSAVRRLTPRECERLQGYEDDYTLITYRGKPAADGPRYKALGNSMAVPVMGWILSRIENLTGSLMRVAKEGEPKS